MNALVTVADVLERAADLIEPEGAWAQVPARVASGHSTWGGDPVAVSWCLLTAISRVSGGWSSDIAAEARRFLKLLVGTDMLGDWNDAPERTKEQVLTALREAAAKSRSELRS